MSVVRDAHRLVIACAVGLLLLATSVRGEERRSSERRVHVASPDLARESGVGGPGTEPGRLPTVGRDVHADVGLTRPEVALGAPLDLLSPAVHELTLSDCGCTGAISTAMLGVTKADVMMAIDLTGSMFQERAELIRHALGIFEGLRGVVPDLACGLISHKDYSASAVVMEPCPYASTYGSRTDYPFALEQPLTTVADDVVTAVNALPLASGGSDAPESYSRVLYEVRTNSDIGWRPGADRFLITFGDEMPHDCNVLECLGDTTPINRGIDLGPDGLPDTGDELAIQDEIDGLAEEGITLVHFESSGGGALEGGYSNQEIWDCWAAQTGGLSVALNADGTSMGGENLAELIIDILGGMMGPCSELSLRTEAGFEAWLVDAGPVYMDVVPPALRDFPITVCVPPDTPLGVHEFEIILDCSGTELARQLVRVTVDEEC
ncbi:MAG: vWA domain-containing protein [Acidobacteriota bacterium]